MPHKSRRGNYRGSSVHVVIPSLSLWEPPRERKPHIKAAVIKPGTNMERFAKLKLPRCSHIESDGTQCKKNGIYLGVRVGNKREFWCSMHREEWRKDVSDQRKSEGDVAESR